MPSTVRSILQSKKRYDEAGIFTPQLKDGRNERNFAACCEISLPVTTAAGEEDEVGAGINEGGRLFRIVAQHLHDIDWKIRLSAEPLNKSSGSWCSPEH